ncbi:hypothetical protein [Texcoconibacillus texcoconensis]|uniref:Uncharacterized protein n=1 Tax=Texcoconibacillus texcoconensis TaxID=1095777 RepID=A0A840QM46_9BACI|nr:hypothetical protein [Texcoconibacillus texcoconensis]MBB5172455.1 hypothetical protein [Texcoconibacillus texcoconensis]
MTSAFENFFKYQRQLNELTKSPAQDMIDLHKELTASPIRDIIDEHNILFESSVITGPMCQDVIDKQNYINEALKSPTQEIFEHSPIFNDYLNIHKNMLSMPENIGVNSVVDPFRELQSFINNFGRYESHDDLESFVVISGNEEDKFTLEEIEGFVQERVELVKKEVGNVPNIDKVLEENQRHKEIIISWLEEIMKSIKESKEKDDPSVYRKTMENLKLLKEDVGVFFDLYLLGLVIYIIFT